MARPTKYTPEREQMILDVVADGLTHKDAAIVSGIDETTLIAWKHRYPNFANQLAHADGARARKWLDGIAAQAPKDWRAYAELLDRCAPDYRKTERHEHTGKDGAPLVITIGQREDGQQ